MDRYRIPSGRSVRTVVLGVALLVSNVAGHHLAGTEDFGSSKAAVATEPVVLAIELARILNDPSFAPIENAHATGNLPAAGQRCVETVFAPTVDVNICDTCADFA